VRHLAAGGLPTGVQRRSIVAHLRLSSTGAGRSGLLLFPPDRRGPLALTPVPLQE
jgi:hypothetical protein